MSAKILVAIEDQFSAVRIVEALINRPWKPETEFIVVHVEEDATPFEVPPSYWADRERAGQAWRDTVTHIASTLQSAISGSRATAAILAGSPKQAILKAVEEYQISTIVMGCHNRQGLSRLLLGSVSHAVAAYAPCSVLVVKPKLAVQNDKVGQSAATLALSPTA